MEILLHILIFSCVVLVVAIAAPSEHLNVEAMKDTSSGGLALGTLNDDTTADLTQGQRQKRWYHYPNFEVPPIYTAPLPSFSYETEEPFRQIYRKIKDISSLVRQSSQPALPWQTSAQFYLPVIFVPQFSECKCPPPNNRPTSSPDFTTPVPSNPPVAPDVPGNPNVTVVNRFPEMEDSRQNWGIAGDENDPGEEEYNRPLSFDPVPPPTPTSRPPPPVEHGSIQAGLSNPTPMADRRKLGSPAFGPPSVPPPPPSFTSNPLIHGQDGGLTECDKAILSCCHRKEVTYQCFVDLDCPNLKPYGNDPCAAKVIFDVATKISRFDGLRTAG